MTVDQDIQDAGARLATLPVAVPELGGLLRRHRRRPSLGAGAMVAVVLLVAAAVGLVGGGPDDRVDTQTADPGPPTIGLAPEGVWPGDGRRFTTAQDLAEAFTTEVLAWDDAAVLVDDAEPNTPTGFTVSRRSNGRDHSIRVGAAPILGNWTIIQIGIATFSLENAGRETRVMIPDGPADTATIRWWAFLDGQETTGTTPAPTGTVTLPAPIEQVGTTLILYLDADDEVIDAIGATTTPGPTLPPSTPVTW